MNNAQTKVDLPDDVVLRVDNVSKKFCRNLKRSLRDTGYGIRDMGYGIWDTGYGIWDMGYGMREERTK
ncbi:MAG: hypothetical protein EOL87_18195 [Spartobacteria bacterium]|nr:hypothetical protein [Spartobacteria bacterium]